MLVAPCWLTTHVECCVPFRSKSTQLLQSLLLLLLPPLLLLLLLLLLPRALAPNPVASPPPAESAARSTVNVADCTTDAEGESTISANTSLSSGPPAAARKTKVRTALGCSRPFGELCTERTPFTSR